ncbi:MAG TPA: aminotransferase class IV, partial [Orrella sp.]
DLHADGHMTLTSAPIQPLETPVGVLLAPDPMDSSDWLLRHKTTDRALYDAAWKQAVALGAFDMLFFNERDELTEGARSNVFVNLEGRWYTPPVTAGVLPGVMRSVLLEDAQLDARIATISRHDLARAEGLMICNALRGALPAQIVSD